MKQKKIQFFGPEIVEIYKTNILECEQNISKLNERLYHLQNKINAVIEVSSSNNPTQNLQFQTLLDKRVRLLTRVEDEKNIIFQNINDMLSSFKYIKIESEKQLKDIYSTIIFAFKRVGFEANKGAVLSNVFSLNISGENETKLFNSLEALIEKDKKILSGYLLQREEKEARTLKFANTDNKFIEFFGNSLYNREKYSSHFKSSDIILKDKGYLERFFDIVGKDYKNINFKQLTKEEKVLVKKQHHTYKVEHKAKAKLASGALKYTAAVPTGLGKLIYGTGYGIGKGLGFLKTSVVVTGLVLASPFIGIGKGLKKLSLYVTKNRTYTKDEETILNNLKDVMKKNKVKPKKIEDVKVSVEEYGNTHLLNLHGVVSKKGNEKKDFSICYVLKEGEYKSFKNLLTEGGEVDKDGEFSFTIGENRDDPSYIRFMRRIAEFTDDDAITLDVGSEEESNENSEEIEQEK